MPVMLIASHEMEQNKQCWCMRQAAVSQVLTEGGALHLLPPVKAQNGHKSEH
jgi:hypothetical protein